MYMQSALYLPGISAVSSRRQSAPLHVTLVDCFKFLVSLVMGVQATSSHGIEEEEITSDWGFEEA